jgi:hypothetical protein
MAMMEAHEAAFFFLARKYVGRVVQAVRQDRSACEQISI